MRFLVVEDDTKLGAVLRQGLEEQGLAVDLHRDGSAGLEAALATDYDAIVLDWMLPGKDGLEFLRGLRAGGNKVPVLMLTARSAVEDRVRGLDLGADDYLPKPFAFAELVARVRALCRRAQPALPPVIESGDLQLDSARRMASRGGDRLDLSAKEFAVLELLMSAQGAVISSEELLARAWDEAADPFSNVVKVTVSRLRRKLGEPDPIETVPGGGYRI